MKRVYENVLKGHFAKEDKMLLLPGPRQVGKTTTSKSSLPGHVYLNWDNQEHRKIILQGPKALMVFAGGDKLGNKKTFLIFDEIHKYLKWKDFLKGFFDTYNKKFKICVIGSARLDVFRHGGDSMMGRYFLYRMHPLSVKEIISPKLKNEEIAPPARISSVKFENLLKFGGYPEPYSRHDQRFSNRWKRLRLEQLFNEDLRDLSRITDIGRIKVLAERLAVSSGSTINYSNLANDIQTSVDTIKRWITLLESIYYCFRVRPYSKNIARSLLKEPKVYLWDWSCLNDPGKRNENLVASHLLKAIHYYTDMGFGDYGLFYLRDKDRREVDFMVTKDSNPWFLVEVKTGDKPISKSLRYFHQVTKGLHAFQLAFNMPFVDADCFGESDPVKVPATTFLSQLV